MTATLRRGVMRWIVETSLRFRFIVVAIAALMMAVGSLQLAKMPVDVFPEFARRGSRSRRCATACRPGTWNRW